VAELTAGHFMFVTLYVNADTWYLMCKSLTGGHCVYRTTRRQTNSRSVKSRTG